jgi:hypothetical protein
MHDHFLTILQFLHAVKICIQLRSEEHNHDNIIANSVHVSYIEARVRTVSYNVKMIVGYADYIDQYGS